MFALEIDFRDGISPPETILVRRPHAVIGSSDSAHVVIEGAAANLSNLRLIRGLGREFSCKPMKTQNSSNSVPFVEGAYSGEIALDLREINTLDQQLYLRISDELYLKRLIVGGLERVRCQR